MAYSEPVGNRNAVLETFTVADDRDRIRWGPIIAGIFVAIATQLILSALGTAIGLITTNSGVVTSIWTVVSLLIALFIGSWVAAAGCSPMNSKTAMLHGLILWATTLAISAWLLASGVSGAFGMAASNAGEVLNQVQQPGGVTVPNQVPNIPTARVEEALDTAAWYFIIGSLLGLAASLIGASVGAKKPRPVRSGIAEPQTPENLAR